MAYNKWHPLDGAEIIRQINNLNDIAEIVKSHHERFDGSCYPTCLGGVDIGVLARMLTLVDSFV